MRSRDHANCEPGGHQTRRRRFSPSREGAERSCYRGGGSAAGRALLRRRLRPPRRLCSPTVRMLTLDEIDFPPSGLCFMRYTPPVRPLVPQPVPWTSQPVFLASCVREGARFGDYTAGQKLPSDDPISLLLRAKHAAETVRAAPAASPSPAVHSAAAPAPLAPSNWLPVRLPCVGALISSPARP